MRIVIDYETQYRYETPSRSLAQLIRVTPRSFDSQYVAAWRLDLDLDAIVRESEDAFGNICHAVFSQKPHDQLTIHVRGEVETADTHGLTTGLPEPLPPEVFLRPTPLTLPGAALLEFAAEVGRGAGTDVLTRLHDLLSATHKKIVFQTEATTAATTAEEAFAAGAGVCQDLTHIFLACARVLGVPARYVSGHLLKLNGQIEQEATHAWAEAFVPDLGWIGFDVANGACPAETHVRVAAGFDYLSAAPVRGVRIGGGREALSVKLNVSDQRRRQHQSSS
jgi:transglutaminase-like putative cysteine protease